MHTEILKMYVTIITMRQFKMLLKKTGWNVIAEEKFTNPVSKIGFRPILRLFTYRYLLIYAEKKF